MLGVLLYREAESLCNNRETTAVTEISNEIMNDGSDRKSENSEPLLVGTNTTISYDASIGNNLTYDTESEPLAVGTNLTIEITYAEAKLLEEQLGINLDGSDDYLGSNITVIDGDRDWLERIDNNPFGSEGMPSPTSDADDSYSWDWSEAEGNTANDGENEEAGATEVDFSSNSNEPLLVGTNITFVLTEDTNGNSEIRSENESLYERDEKTPFALGTNLLLELPDEEGQDNYLGTNLSTIEDNSETQTTAMEGDSLGGGMIPTEFANPTSSDNEDYAWDFDGQLARFTTDASEGMGEDIDADALFAASPWGVLEETGAVDGFEDVFPNGAGEIENNPFAGGFGGGEI